MSYQIPFTVLEANHDITIAIAPGLANSSEDGYIRSFALEAINQGYRVLALNLLGVIPDEKLTTRRIFDFGKYIIPC